MKKFTIVLLLMVIAIAGKSQTEKITGSWLLTKAEVEGEVILPYYITDFHKDGKMEVMEMEAGTWEYDESTNSILMHSEMDEAFDGENKILKITENELVVDKNGATLSYVSVNRNEIASENEKSGLTGTWEFEDETNTGLTKIIIFEEPDAFTIIEKEDGMESTSRGQWIFNKQEMALILIGLRHADEFHGENRIVKLEDDTFELEFNNKLYKANRKQESGLTAERLTFSEDDFYTADGDFKYYEDEQKLPWQDWDAKKISLIGVKNLVYVYSVLINGSAVFEQKMLTADVKASLEEEAFSIDNIFNGYDRYQLPEDTEFPSNEDYTNLLYPLDDDIYRVAGTEQITTPAGTFDCTVVEAINDSGIAKKLWLINDKPGIYAKIIEDDPDTSFGHYYLYELKEVR